jgi:hypothetical protein
VNVVAAISEQLRSIGLDHLPPGPPSRPEPRNQHVLVFRTGSEAGAVINAVRNGTRRLGSAPGRLLDQAVKEL